MVSRYSFIHFRNLGPVSMDVHAWSRQLFGLFRGFPLKLWFKNTAGQILTGTGPDMVQIDGSGWFSKGQVL